MSCHLAQQLDLLGYGKSCIHRLDSRSKLIAAAAFVVCVMSFPKYSVAALVPLFIVPLVIAALGDVPPRLIARMLLIASPFAIMVGVFNPLIDRDVWLRIGPIAVGAGWLSFASILLRFVLSLSIVLVLVATTSVPRLLTGIRRLGIPRPFVTQLQFLYRYLFLLVEEADSLAHARQLREPQRSTPNIHTAKNMIYSLLWRTWERANRVFLCMRARGFSGDFPVSSNERLRLGDAIFLLFCIGVSLAARFLPLTQTIGRWLLRG